MRNCLVIVRAGDDSLHPGWVKNGAARGFDLLVSYYGTSPDRFRAEADHYHVMPGPRWPAHHALCQQQWELLRRYDYIAFACDDLEAEASTWDRLFAVCRAYRLDLAQPAIEGPVSHLMMGVQPGCRLRYTNFVEIMCPVFHRPVLEKLRPTLSESVSGWGLDYLWSALLPTPPFKLAIVDSAPVRHVRPLDSGALQQSLRDHGIDKVKEAYRLLARHGTAPSPMREYTRVHADVAPETAVKILFDSLSATQRREIHFDWNYQDPRRGLLRSFLANHWQITRPCVRSDFFTGRQQELIHAIFKGILHPDWYARFLKQLQDDTKGHPWGADQSIALFGTPGAGPFQFVITGRHLTLRADGYADGRVAFGGPLFYGHAAGCYRENPGHPGNVFWPQAQRVSGIYRMLDSRQRQRARVHRLVEEPGITFQGAQGRFPGLPVAELTVDQKRELLHVLDVLVEPFRLEDRLAVLTCLIQQGGPDRCSLAFYQENQMSPDAWDSWRLEGPSFVWYFRGVPHVHVWVHVASDATAPDNSRAGAFLFPEHDPLL